MATVANSPDFKEGSGLFARCGLPIVATYRQGGLGESILPKVESGYGIF